MFLYERQNKTKIKGIIRDYATDYHARTVPELHHNIIITSVSFSFHRDGSNKCIHRT